MKLFNKFYFSLKDYMDEDKINMSILKEYYADTRSDMEKYNDEQDELERFLKFNNVTTSPVGFFNPHIGRKLNF